MRSNNLKDRVALSVADLEPIAGHATLGEDAFKALHSQSCIRVHSVRKKLTDSDGVSAKAVIDALVLAGVLRGDSPEFVKEVSYSQEKGETEYTVITITEARLAGEV